MKKLLLQLILLFTIKIAVSQSCSCHNTNGFYTSFVNTTSNNNTGVQDNLNQSNSLLSSGKYVHLWFPKSPSQNITPSCYGYYSVTINNQTFTSQLGSSRTSNQSIYIPTSALVVGANILNPIAKCGANSICTTVSQTINIVEVGASTANITLTKECCLTSPTQQNGYRSVPNGQVRYKMTGTASNAVKLRIQTPTGSSDLNFNNSGYLGCYTGSFKITVIDGLENIMTNATVNGNVFNNNFGCHYRHTIRSPRFNSECISVRKPEKIKINDVSASLACTGNADCPMGQNCVNGTCQ